MRANGARSGWLASRPHSFAVLGVLLLVTQPSTAQVEVIAHRGNSSQAPENTLASINSAFAIGADHVELDIALTSDGIAVLMHDATVDRTTDGTGPISSLTLAQVQSLDAGSWFGPAFVGERVPTLAEALVAADQRGRILLDVKAGGMGAAIQAAINDAAILSGKTFTASDLWIWPGPNADYEANIVEPEYLLGSVPSTITWQTPGYFDAQKALGVVGWDVGGGMTSEFAAAAKAEGMVASVFTINSESAMRSWIDVGVTAMETDFPQLMIDVIATYVPPIPPSGDLNGDGAIDVDDWVALRDSQHSDLSGLTDEEAFMRGDINLDGTNNHADFVLFKSLYLEAHGPGSFAAIFAVVPEPTTFALSFMVVFGWLSRPAIRRSATKGLYGIVRTVP